MSFVGAIVIGFFAGIAAKLLMPGRDPGGFIVTILLGMGGAVLATWIGHTLGFYQADQSAGLVGAIVGAVVILLIYRLAWGRRRA
ncbi:MAG: GlsB/YeaQ/YmgE family stress response membrane protein [Magnetospirillum sp.]|nr:GlsB/YeaQ/YmgE family stress response membrane protein [Magnetospirillum sp.]